jgi:hypothetical protein
MSTRKHRHQVAIPAWLLGRSLADWPAPRAGWRPYRWRDPARVSDGQAEALEQLRLACDDWWAADLPATARLDQGDRAVA